MLEFDLNPGVNEDKGSVPLSNPETNTVQKNTREASRNVTQKFPDKYIQARKDLETAKRFLMEEGLPEKDLYEKEVLSVIDVSKDEKVMAKRLFLKGNDKPLTYDSVWNGVRTTHLSIDAIFLLLRSNQSLN